MAVVAQLGFKRVHALKPIRVLALPKYGPLGSASRLRFLQYFAPLRVAGLVIEQSSLLSDGALRSRYQTGDYSHLQLIQSYASRIKVLLKKGRFDLLWIEKEALPWFPLWLEITMLGGVPFILDFDDAVFHNYDQHGSKWVRQLYGQRIDGLMAKSALVVGGNAYLCDRANHAGAPWVELLPTVIDLERYPVTSAPKALSTDGLLRIVWIGSPYTVRYLKLLQAPLQQLAQRVPFVLRVIGGKIDMLGVHVETIDWAEDSEVESIASAHVGVMPLSDSPWERGKCGYKLIQYMACGLPVVASPIGVNTEIVQEGINGFLAHDASTWVNTLEQLLTQPELATKMGQAGRKRVESEYCLQVTAPKLEKLMRQVVTQSRTTMGMVN